jgi:2,3-dihydroxy-p-cumate/2,3-dihydroxybenzoate 3,4-dioxygenase
MIRFKKLGYLAFNVAKLERSTAFYRDMVGLDLVERNDAGMSFLSCNGDYHNVLLVQADAPGLKRIAFELEDPAQLVNARETLDRAGVRWWSIPQSECGRLRIGQGIRLADPDGFVLELYVGMVARPQKFVPHPIDLVQLSHCVIHVPNFKRTLAFYAETLNFRVSDFRHEPNGDPYFAFMRCFPNPFHHSLAIVKRPKAEFFHVAFSVRSLDDLMFGRNRLLKAGVTVAPSPGRHMASGSIFQYFSDPDGITIEYTSGMEEFPELGARQPRMLDQSYRTTDVWDGERPTNLRSLGNYERAETAMA